MTEAEALKVIGLLTTFFPGRLQKESIQSWSKELKSYSFDDGSAGAREHGRTAEHPSLKGLIDCIESERARRARESNQRLDRVAIPAQAAGLDDGRHERTAAAARAARELVESLARKKAMPAPDRAPAPVNARNGHETQTPQEAEARARLLREQAEQLMRTEGGIAK